jgi:hypothetical protein
VTGIRKTTAHVRVLTADEIAEHRPSEEDVRDSLDRGLITQREIESDDFHGSASPEVVVVAWFSALLDDGRVVHGPIETRIGTGLSEDEADEDSIRDVIDFSLGSGSGFAIEREGRWDRLIERLARDGVDATPQELDAVDRDLALDLGPLAPNGSG